MQEFFEKNISKPMATKEKRRAIIGAKQLAFLTSMAMFTKGDKVFNPKYDNQQKRIIELKQSVEQTYPEAQIDSSLIDAKDKVTAIHPEKENDSQSEPVVETNAYPSDSTIPKLETLDSSINTKEPTDNEIENNKEGAGSPAVEKSTESFNEQKTARSTEAMMDDLLVGLKGDHGILASLVRGKIKDHKEEIVKAIYTIDEFKSQNEKYLPMLDSMYWFSDKPNIRNGQINSMAITYELYKNGSLEKICNPGLLVNLYSKVSKENVSLYKTIKDDIKRIKNLPLEERQDWIKEVFDDTKITVTVEELEHLIILARIASVMEDFMWGLQEYKEVIKESKMVSKAFNSCLAKNPEIPKSIENFRKEIMK